MQLGLCSRRFSFTSIRSDCMAAVGSVRTDSLGSGLIGFIVAAARGSQILMLAMRGIRCESAQVIWCRFRPVSGGDPGVRPYSDGYR